MFEFNSFTYIQVLTLISQVSTRLLHPDLINDEEVTHTALLTVSINNEVQKHKVEINLFGNIVPKTVTNFMTICSGAKKEKTRWGQNYTYDGTFFHRIVPQLVVHGGDFTSQDGLGGVSIYGDYFPDENFKIQHTEGTVSMHNHGLDTNGSQFFMVLHDMHWLDGKNVAFGRMHKKSRDLVRHLSSFGSHSGAPRAKIRIEKCELTESGYSDM